MQHPSYIPKIDDLHISQRDWKIQPHISGGHLHILDMIEDHKSHLQTVFTRLWENKLYLKWSKCDLYTKEMKCLGHKIDENWIHLDVDKLQCIRDWRTPQNYHDVQRFVGLVNYMANFLPNITSHTTPLQAMVQNRTPFFWQPIHDRCLQIIKCICCKTPIIKLLDYSSTESICNASKMGVGFMYIMLFMSKKHWQYSRHSRSGKTSSLGTDSK